MNKSYYHWLIKTLVWPIAGQIEPGRKSKQKYRGKKGRVREMTTAVGDEDGR